MSTKESPSRGVLIAVITAIGVVLAAAITALAPIIARHFEGSPNITTQTAVTGHVITQIRVGDPTALAEGASRHLKENGIEIDATRPVDRDKAPSASEVRYYYDSDAALARRVAGLLAESGVPATARDFSKYKASRPPERGVVEVWFALK